MIAKTTRALCATCGRKLLPGTQSVAFRAHHARCIERAIAKIREFD